MESMLELLNKEGESRESMVARSLSWGAAQNGVRVSIEKKDGEFIVKFTDTENGRSFANQYFLDAKAIFSGVKAELVQEMPVVTITLSTFNEKAMARQLDEGDRALAMKLLKKRKRHFTKEEKKEFARKRNIKQVESFERFKHFQDKD